MGPVFVTKVSWVPLVTCAPIRRNSDQDATKLVRASMGIVTMDPMEMVNVNFVTHSRSFGVVGRPGMLEKTATSSPSHAMAVFTRRGVTLIRLVFETGQNSAVCVIRVMKETPTYSVNPSTPARNLTEAAVTGRQNARWTDRAGTRVRVMRGGRETGGTVTQGQSAGTTSTVTPRPPVGRTPHTTRLFVGVTMISMATERSVFQTICAITTMAVATQRLIVLLWPLVSITARVREGMPGTGCSVSLPSTNLSLTTQI